MNFEENQVPEAILDKLTKVCTCRSITRKTIKEAILDGAHTFPQVKEATRAGQYYINHRWLGGTLTNYKTIKGRIDRIAEIEKMEADGVFEVLPKKEVGILLKELDKLEK